MTDPHAKVAPRDPADVGYVFVDTTAGAVEALREMMAADVVAMDTETEVLPGSDLDRDGPGPWVVLSAAARFPDGTEKVWVIDVSNVDTTQFAEVLDGSTIFAWNASFEDAVLTRGGAGDIRWLDLMLHLATLDQGRATENKPFYTGLNAAAQRYLGIELEGKGSIQLSYKAGVPLTEEQKAYAAQDAIVTLWLEPIIDGELDEAGLRFVAEDLESAARPFIQAMFRHGFWLDVEGWRGVLAKHAVAKAEAGNRLAELTGGGQGNLFSDHAEPPFKPNSADDVKRMLNTHCEELVRAYTKGLDKSSDGRLLGKWDSVEADTLKLIGGDLADALREWSKHDKVLSTYGEAFIAKLWDDDRLHAKYLQTLLATGRLSSEPNAQNLPPEMKPFLRPTSGHGRVDQLDDATLAELGPRGVRVIAYADASQAELRWLTQESKDPVLMESYLTGADIHATTARTMFGADMEGLATAAKRVPEIEAAIAHNEACGDTEAVASLRVELAEAKAAGDQYNKLRAQAKPYNFGVCYGLGAAAAAQQLSVAGIPTTREEATKQLELFNAGYAGVDRYLRARDQFVADLAANLPPLDFEKTWKLHKAWKPVKDAYFGARKALGHNPSLVQVAERFLPSDAVERKLARQLGRTPTPDETAEAVAERDAHVAWVRSFKVPVVFRQDGKPFTWESRTRGGRRRLFEVTSDEWITAMVNIAAKTRKPEAAAVRDRFAKENGMTLSTTNKKGQTVPLSNDRIRKAFEGTRGKELKESFVSYVFENMPGAAFYLQREAVSECVKAKGNQYRNHPIQGGVADAAFLAYAKLWDRLKPFGDAMPVQTVHDSILIECALEDADRVATILKETFEEALSFFCPDVPMVADAAILATADDKHDEISTERLAEMLAAARGERNATAA